MKKIFFFIVIYIFLSIISFVYNVYWEEVYFDYERPEVDLGDGLSALFIINSTSGRHTVASRLIPLYSSWINSGQYKVIVVVEDNYGTADKVCFSSAVLIEKGKSKRPLNLTNKYNQIDSNCFLSGESFCFTRLKEEYPNRKCVHIYSASHFNLDGEINIKFDIDAFSNSSVIKKSVNIDIKQKKIYKNGWFRAVGPIV